MSPGHKSLGGFEKGFQANAKVQAVFVSIPQCELIDHHRTKCETTRVGQSFGRHLTVRIEHALELLVQVLDRPRAQLMKHPSHLNTTISMWICTATGGHHLTVG